MWKGFTVKIMKALEGGLRVGFFFKFSSNRSAQHFLCCLSNYSIFKNKFGLSYLQVHFFRQIFYVSNFSTVHVICLQHCSFQYWKQANFLCEFCRWWFKKRLRMIMICNFGRDLYTVLLEKIFELKSTMMFM